MSLPDLFPNVITAALTIKIGDPQTNTRRCIGDIKQIQLTVSEGYAVFREKVKAAIKQETAVRWPEESPIMIKPTTSATQAQYEEMASNEFILKQQLARLWNLAARRRSGYVWRYSIALESEYHIVRLMLQLP